MIFECINYVSSKWYKTLYMYLTNPWKHTSMTCWLKQTPSKTQIIRFISLVGNTVMEYYVLDSLWLLIGVIIVTMTTTYLFRIQLILHITVPFWSLQTYCNSQWRLTLTSHQGSMRVPVYSNLNQFISIFIGLSLICQNIFEILFPLFQANVRVVTQSYLPRRRG